MIAYVLFDAVLAFFGITFYSREMFVLIGIASMFEATTYWIVPLDASKPQRQSLRGIGADLRHQVLPLFIIFVNLLTTTYTDSMSPYLVSELVPDPVLLGQIWGWFTVITCVLLPLGWVIFTRVRYTVLLPAVYIFELAALLCLMFLNESTPTAVVFAMVMVHACLTTVGDAVVQLFAVQASGMSSAPTFVYAAYQSILNVGYVVASSVFPLVKTPTTWIQFWAIGIGVMIVGFIVTVVLVAIDRRSDIMQARPTVDTSCFRAISAWMKRRRVPKREPATPEVEMLSVLPSISVKPESAPGPGTSAPLEPPMGETPCETPASAEGASARDDAHLEATPSMEVNVPQNNPEHTQSGAPQDGVAVAH